MYVGNGTVAEMIGSGYHEVSLATWYNTEEYVDIYRNTHIGNLGPVVAAVARSYSGTRYAPYEIEVLGVTALSPAVVGPIITSQRTCAVFGPRRWSTTYDLLRVGRSGVAEVGNAATLDVTLWPTLDLIGSLSNNFRWDFTTPTVLSAEPGPDVPQSGLALCEGRIGCGPQQHQVTAVCEPREFGGIGE